MSGIPEATAIILTEQERTELEALARSTKTEHRLPQRARIVLLAADGKATRAIARAMHCTIGTASKWRVRFAKERLAGLNETGERGAEPKYTAETDRRILAVLDNPPPEGFARWTGPLVAKALGDVDVQYVWRSLRAQKIDLSGCKSWCESNDPEFAAKAAEIVGLYLDPPDNALVLAVDEKPHIQALERAQGYLKLPNGRALSWSLARLQASWHQHAVCRSQCDQWRDHGAPLSPPPSHRIPRLHEPHRCRLARARNPRHPRQP